MGEVEQGRLMDREQIEMLIARVAMNDRAAFNALYDATSAKLFGVSLRVLSNRAAAEDAMQDSFVKIWKNASRYQSNGLSPMTWLITIARNTAIDRLRATRKGHVDIDHRVLSWPHRVRGRSSWRWRVARRGGWFPVWTNWPRIAVPPYAVPIWTGNPMRIWPRRFRFRSTPCAHGCAVG